MISKYFWCYYILCVTYVLFSIDFTFDMPSPTSGSNDNQNQITKDTEAVYNDHNIETTVKLLIDQKNDEMLNMQRQINQFMAIVNELREQIQTLEQSVQQMHQKTSTREPKQGRTCKDTNGFVRRFRERWKEGDCTDCVCRVSKLFNLLLLLYMSDFHSIPECLINHRCSISNFYDKKNIFLCETRIPN